MILRFGPLCYQFQPSRRWTGWCFSIAVAHNVATGLAIDFWRCGISLGLVVTKSQRNTIDMLAEQDRRHKELRKAELAKEPQ